ncbi:MAG TPA: GGDEF domain-containing protein [Humidesulfovibrio sp.]|uniref:GGDEF domain-containing protein n=1 Tax=Humidesulfovibrio sp. TaxID=2910988 RepID=UPI002C5BC3D0|nr:GGDEF domain-containing protein [Humidesulfovibrio sp.]HWR02385.1 GGDEF domain-containing protein [Humidesulfovibrio sp.]
MDFIRVIYRLLLTGGWIKYRGLFLTLGIATCFLVGWIDYITTDEVNLSFVYLVPIFFTTLAARRSGGVAMALTCAVVKVLTDVYSDQPYARSVFYLFNGLGLFLAFGVFALLLDMLRQAYRRECDVFCKDELTGLPNRFTFFETAAKVWENCREAEVPLCLIVVDIDNLKGFNCDQGEHMGDMALQAVARVAGRTLAEDCPLHRIGGDDFAVILPAHDAQEARQTAAALQEKLTQAMRDKKWPLTFSCCVIALGGKAADLDAALHQASALLRAAKQNGEGAVLVEAGG